MGGGELLSRNTPSCRFHTLAMLGLGIGEGGRGVRAGGEGAGLVVNGSTTAGANYVNSCLQAGLQQQADKLQQTTLRTWAARVASASRASSLGSLSWM